MFDERAIEKIARYENPFMLRYNTELRDYYIGYYEMKRKGWCEKDNPLYEYLLEYNKENHGGMQLMTQDLLEAIAENWYNELPDRW